MNEILSLARMARRLGVTQQWLRAEADAGRVPCLKAGKRYLFNPDAAERELLRQALGPQLSEIILGDEAGQLPPLEETERPQ
jgi:hypothetical protein